MLNPNLTLAKFSAELHEMNASLVIREYRILGHFYNLKKWLKVADMFQGLVRNMFYGDLDTSLSHF